MAINPWQRIDVSTLNSHIVKLSEPMYRKRKILGALRKRGRISMNRSGKKVDWRVAMRRATPATHDDMLPSTPARVSRWKSCELGWISYRVTEAISKFEKLVQGNREDVLIKIVAEMVPVLARDMTSFFGDKFWVDGNATGYTEDLQGLESWFGVDGTVTNGVVGNPSDTYATRSTALGEYGSWTPDTGKGWPTGTGGAPGGSPEYCYFSPLVVDYTNTGWSAATKTWINTCREVLRFATLYMGNLQDVQPDAFILNAELYRQFLDALEDKERIYLDGGNEFVKLGFGNVSFDGIPITTEFGVPTGVGVGLVFDELELRSMQSQLFAIEKDKEITTQTELIDCDFWGQLVCKTPAFQTKLQAIS